MSIEDPGSRLARRMLKLKQYFHEILDKPENINDTLSRIKINPFNYCISFQKKPYLQFTIVPLNDENNDDKEQDERKTRLTKTTNM